MSLPSPVSEPLQARCARHVAEAAVSTCARCGSYACTTCLRYGADGQQYCLACVAQRTEMADRGQRFVARLIDVVLSSVPMFAGLVLAAATSAASAEDPLAKGGIALLSLAAYALGATVSVGNALYEAITGQSVGKRLVRIKVVRADGTDVHPARMLFLRSMLPVLIGSASCGVFNLVDALFVFADNRRCLHDLIADTQVVPARR